MCKTLATAVLAVAMGGILALPARANIVANGNFSSESASIPGFPPDDWGSSGNAGAEQTDPNTGDTWDAYFGETTGSLYQLLTTPGTTYTLSFAVAADSAALGDPASPGFYACFDPAATSCDASTDLFGGAIFSELGGAYSYTVFTDTITATAANMYLSFTGTNTNGGNFYLDDVDVESNSTPMPEPSVLLMLASALGLLTLMRVRRA